MQAQAATEKDRCYRFAKRVKTLRASEIREILKVTQRKEIISFAGGLPAPELFPVEEMKAASIRVMEERGREALQYSGTEGYLPLRQKIAERMNRKFKTDFCAEQLLIPNGSQQALDFIGKLFLDEGDVVLWESPTYLAAISAFRAYGPRFVEVPTDEGGMELDALEKILKTTPQVKLIYVIPDFQNPTGKTWPVERRRKFIELTNRYEIPVVEDNPYGELRFENEIPPSLQSFDCKQLVICLGTFSKTFSPGLRIGWIAASDPIIEGCVMIKQAADLCTSLKLQMELCSYMETCDFEAQIGKIIKVYRSRRDVMLETLAETMPEGVTYTRPEGGLFLWMELPAKINTMTLLQECLKEEVAFVPGEPFYPNGGITNRLRLNYSNMPEERIREGIRRIAAVIRRNMLHS